MTVTANYANGTSKDVTDFVTVSPSTFTVAGNITVTVEYSTKSATFVVTVGEKSSTEIGSGSEGTISWSISSDGTLTVSGSGEISDYDRTGSGVAPWASYKKSINKIVVTDGITGIGKYAFYGLSKATEIEIAASVKEIGLQFIRGTAIKEIDVSNVEVINASAFASAESLETIKLGEALNDVKGDIFFNITATVKAPAESYAAKYVEIYSTIYAGRATVTLSTEGTAAVPVIYFGKAGDTVFYAIYQNSSANWSYVISGTGRMKNYPYVTEKNIALGYTFAPTYYLSNAELKNILTIEVKSDVTTIGNFAFYRCTKASTLNLHDNITFIGRGAFYACAKLKTINVPENVTTIQRTAFNGCTGLENLYIPAGVTVVEDQIFVKCTDVSKITVTTKSEAAIAVISAEYPTVTIVSE